ncbi:lanthionine synthetase LanC family protein [Engelhardtia mirabilis]|uniref:Lanthionine synthetase C-like protein n=1 Tax=Engelhardtia mirabilis TaxID=2528011 RepID=A0A518BHS8_9BACT|nr:Lanthionine synthetase C-like protein [Planctomycetes bacterium Pla133]QDV00854.1 Lanthionine synthetase C-like protein [Planctomycetes bacterium Pla86]
MLTTISTRRSEAPSIPASVPQSDNEQRGRDLGVAASIGWRLVREAHWDGQRCNWIGASMELRPAGWQAVERSFGPDLYAGTSGIAVFLARLYALTGEACFARTAQGAMSQALSRFDRFEGPLGHGFYAGSWGVVWAAREVGSMVADGALVEWAADRVRLGLHADLSAAPTDLIGGAAGAIGALLDLEGESKDGSATALALRYGEHLLSKSRADGDGMVWDTMEQGVLAPLCGLGHGVAGIAWSLLELAQATGDGRFREAARAGHRYERRLFDESRGNWPDLRDHSAFGGAAGEPSFGVAWCHGAVGIGIARERSMRLDSSDHELAREYAVAARTTAAHIHQLLDAGGADASPCHGLTAGVELLASLGEAAGDLDPRDGVSRFRTLGLTHEAEGRAWPCGVLGGGEAPGLMLGLAGIGHAFLRLADPVGCPSLLLVGPR